ncbi:TetR/AcrR family transcriptional regulator [Nocardia sp. NPDC005998]|uniref:TetR/AcrR family transcriptional regulator n=1 Tax=Nocardia sp. NPDC005998 TaxID=3156894 RepID=UPI0033A2F068
MDIDKRPTIGPRKAEEIFAATLKLLTEKGYDSLTIESVAAESGVNKTTIYRWWPSKDALLAATLVASQPLTFAVPDTGSLRGDLLGLARSIAELLTADRTAPIIAPVFAAAPRRPELGQVARAFFADRLAREQPIFQRAIERGELPPTADPKTIMDMLAGSIWFRVLLRGEAVTPEHLDHIVDMVLHGAVADA